MGINLESSLALWVNFLGISLPFLGSCSLWFTALFGIVSFPSGLARLHDIVQYHSLSRSSWLLLSLLILALDSFFEKFYNSASAMSLLWMGPSHRKNAKINLASFRLWPPCCVTPLSSSSVVASNTASHNNYKKNHFMGFFWFPMMPMGLHPVWAAGLCYYDWPHL